MITRGECQVNSPDKSPRYTGKREKQSGSENCQDNSRELNKRDTI